MDMTYSHKLSAGIAGNLVAILEEAIVFLELAPSERLTEEDVAERYGVSRSPAREALRSLENDGLVLREARKGIWVTPMSLRDFDDIYRCRIRAGGHRGGTGGALDQCGAEGTALACSGRDEAGAGGRQCATVLHP